MAGDFQVRPSDLTEAVSGFQGLLGQLQTAAGQVKGESAGSAGDPRLTDALSAFLSHWGGGLDKLHGSLSELSTRVSEAAAKYEVTDTQVSSKFGS